MEKRTMETYRNEDGSFGVIIPGDKLTIIECATLYECATEAEAFLRERNS